MIFDRIERWEQYKSVGTLLARALEKVASRELESWATGRHQIDGDDLIAIVEAYDTRPIDACFWEGHRHYIDVQYVVAGVEAMDVAPIEATTILKPYNETKDFTVFDVPENRATRLIVASGTFAVFFPTDIHRPGVAPGGAVAPVRKIVMKVRV